MSYNGLEIDVLSLGNADSILVTRWSNGVPTRVLIDGGNAGSASTVREFLGAQGITHIQHVVCTHPHDDHVAGLVDLVMDESLTFDCGWMHIPRLHVDVNAMLEAVRSAKGSLVAQIVQKSVETSDRLFLAFQARGLSIHEPFQGAMIGFLVVCGPSKEYYEQLLLRYKDPWMVQSLNADLALRKILGELREDSLVDDPQTAPENKTSTILATHFAGSLYVLTADAGAQALERAASAYALSGCYWMQIPHHGSRNNVTRALIEHFAPQVAFVSAEGSRKHPSQAVVNAFKKVGTRVFSTHYPSPAHLYHSRGVVPTRSRYGPAVPLWQAASAVGTT